MSTLTIVAGTAAMLGAAVIAGVFFAFSSFVMKALAHLPTAQGAAAMRSINVDVLNRSFLGAFLGTALVSLGVAAVALADPRPASPYYLGGAVSYLVGTFLVTIRRNVPLNERLAAAAADGPDMPALWRDYQAQWTRWNHVRTTAATGAALLYSAGLLQTGCG